eukprot:6186125-Pleurochrysis_carterae.AAC.3
MFEPRAASAFAPNLAGSGGANAAGDEDEGGQAQNHPGRAGHAHFPKLPARIVRLARIVCLQESCVHGYDKQRRCKLWRVITLAYMPTVAAQSIEAYVLQFVMFWTSYSSRVSLTGLADLKHD